LRAAEVALQRDANVSAKAHNALREQFERLKTQIDKWRSNHGCGLLCLCACSSTEERKGTAYGLPGGNLVRSSLVGGYFVSREAA
jgi:hypothetical protein